MNNNVQRISVVTDASSIRGWGAFVVFGHLAICGFGCHEDSEPSLPGISWSSEDFDFATDVTDQICGGSLSFQQTFVDRAQGVLGEPDAGEKFTYYLLSSYSFATLVGDQNSGLYNNRRVFETVIPELHEVTHAVVDMAVGRSHPFFNEGIAEVFRDRYGYDGNPDLVTLMYALQFDGVHEDFPSDAYIRAGHFMSYALAVYGQTATAKLLALARPGDPPERLLAAMAEAFGMGAEEIIADYNDYPLCRHGAYRWPIAECDTGTRLEPVGGVWRIDAELNCSHPDVLGPRDGFIWRANFIEIPRSGQYRVSLSGKDGNDAVVVLGHCSPGCAPDKGMEVEFGEERVVTLRQGRYHVTSESGRWVETAVLQTKIEAVDPEGLAMGGG